MSNAIIGWRSAIPAASLTASPASPAGLDVSQLQNDQGATSTAWQTPGTAASVIVDTGAPGAVWRAFMLARTNLTAAGSVRWRVGSLLAMTLPGGTLYSAAGLTLASDTTSGGAITDNNGTPNAARAFVNGTAGGVADFAAFGSMPVVSGQAYALKAWVRRVDSAGSMPIGFRVADPVGAYWDSGVVAAGGAWQLQTVMFTATATGFAVVYFGLAVPSVTFGVSNFTLFPTGAYDSGMLSPAVAPGYGQSIIIAPTDVTGQAARLDISDPTNPDGLLNIPLAYAGPAWQPNIGVSWASTFGRDDTTDEVVTRGGQEFPVNRFVRRRWAIELDAIRASEIWTQVSDLDRVSRAGGNVVFLPDITSATLLNEAIFGRCKATQDISFPYAGADARSWKANITERL